MDKIFPAVQVSLPIFFMIVNKYNCRKIPKLNGKVAVVGNGSNGLGQKICMNLAQYGCNIVIVDSLPADETMKKLKEFNINSMTFKVDVTNEKEVYELKEEVMRKFGRVDYLVNIAGRSCYKTIFENTNDEVLGIMEREFTAVRNLTNAFIDEMKVKNSGSVFTILGTKELVTYPFAVDLSVVKFKLSNYMDSLQYSLKEHNFTNIKISCFIPSIKSIQMNKYDEIEFMTSIEYIQRILKLISTY